MDLEGDSELTVFCKKFWAFAVKAVSFLAFFLSIEASHSFTPTFFFPGLGKTISNNSQQRVSFAYRTYYIFLSRPVLS